MKWGLLFLIFVLIFSISFAVFSANVHALTLGDVIDAIVSALTGQTQTSALTGAVLSQSCGCNCQEVCTGGARFERCRNVCACSSGCSNSGASCTTNVNCVATTSSTTTTITTMTTETTSSSSITTTTTPTSYIKNGKYVDVDWSVFPSNPEVSDWGVKTGDDQYTFLAKIQNVPMNMMRSKTPVKLDNGIGGWASDGKIGVSIDWLLGKNLISPTDPNGPSYGMTPKNYSLQRLDAEYYHELAHNIPKPCSVTCPGWFAEGLGTWAQSAVTEKGAYTGIKASMEDALYDFGAYSSPDIFGGYGKTAAFFWWLIEKYGIEGFHKMIYQCFGWGSEHAWANNNDVNTYGFIPLTGKNTTQLAQLFYNDISSGWRANITNVLKKIDLSTIPQTNVSCYQTVNIRAQLDSCNFETPSQHGCYDTIPAKITVTYYKDEIKRTQEGLSSFEIIADLESNIIVSTGDTAYNFVSWNDFGCWGWAYDNPHTYYLHSCAPLEINKRTIIGYFKPSTTNCVYGTATATNSVNYGSYKIFTDVGSNFNWVKIVVKDSGGNTVETKVINQLDTWSFSAGFTVRVVNVAALQDGTVIRADLVVGPTGTYCAFCSDSDNGPNYYVKGTATNGSHTLTDECELCTGACISEQPCPPVICGGVKEYYCLDNKIFESHIACPSGYKCSNGACISQPQQKHDIQVGSLYYPGIGAKGFQENVPFNVSVGIVNNGDFAENVNVEISVCPSYVVLPTASELIQTQTITTLLPACIIIPIGGLNNKNFTMAPNQSLEVSTITSLSRGHYKMIAVARIPVDATPSNNQLSYTFEVIEFLQSFSINYKAGWNLFSIPVAYVSTSNSNCQPESPVWGMYGGNYYETTYTSGGYGYWVKMKSDCTTNITGRNITISNFPTLNEGWNMIGATSEAVNIDDVKGTCNIQKGPMWYDPSIGNYVKSSVLQPGKGYFVKVEGSCRLGTGLPPPPPS